MSRILSFVRIITRAIKGTEFEGIQEYLEGPTAIAVSKSDATAPARVLANFAKTAQALEIKAGIVEGTLYDAKGMGTIAAIPSRDELLSKLLGSFKNPITNFARVMNQLAEKGGASACEAPAKEEAAEAPAEEPAKEEASAAESAEPVAAE